MSNEFEIRDANGKVIGCGSGDPAWARKTMEDFAARGLVNPGSRATVPLRVVSAEPAPAATPSPPPTEGEGSRDHSKSPAGKD